MENIAYAINLHPPSKKKAGHEKCILKFDSWKTFVFLSNFYISLTPKPILIKNENKQKNYVSTKTLINNTEKFRV